MVPIPLRGSVNGAGGVSRTLDCTILRARHPQTERQPRGVHGPREASALIVFGLWSRRFRRPWSGDVPSGESVNPGGWAMADETPKAPEPELSIAPEGEAKPPAPPDGWAPPETPRAREDHDGEVDPANRGGAGRQALSEYGGSQLALGRRGRDAQVLRGDPRRPEASCDPERSQDQLDLQSRE